MTRFFDKPGYNKGHEMDSESVDNPAKKGN